MRRRLAFPLLLAVLSTLLIAGPASAMTAEIWFPVQITDGVVHHDNYGDCRSGCSRSHKGNDIMAPQMTEVYAAESGYIRRAYGGDDRSCLDGGYCESTGFLIYGDDGNSYFYLHLNNDTPGRPSGTCDKRGGAENAFSPRLVKILRERGSLEPKPYSYSSGDVVRVKKGELIGYVGSSGNAGCKVDHLHYEMWGGHNFYGANDSRKSDPYPFLKAAKDAGRFWGPNGAVTRPAPESNGRVAGSNRVLTSVELSQVAFASSQTVVIAPAEVYPEALVAAPLGATMKAPVLLTWNQQAGSRDQLDDAVAAEIKRLGATYAVIVGDESRFGSELESQLVEKTSLKADSIRRIGGADRFELSQNVADQIAAYHGMEAGIAGESTELPFAARPAANDGGEPATISPVLALGQHEVESRGWPDALASSSLAARDTVPVLLSQTNTLPAATREFLQRDGIGEVRLIGGTAAISQKVEDEIKALGLETRRIAGSNRFATSLAVAEEALATGARNSRVWVATGSNYPDALASGQTVAALGNVIVLVDGANKDGAASVFGWLRDNAAAVERLEAIGGEAVVSREVLGELAIHANWPR